MGLKQLYKSEVKREIEKFKDLPKETFTEQDIQYLPEPVQNYFRYCGYMGKEKLLNAEIIWENAFLRTAPDKDWMKIDCNQFNSVPEPCRIVYMKNYIKGIIPFEGRDKLQDGHGNMLIKLMKFITIADDKSSEMDRSAMVTTLAETFLLPAYSLQNYMKWNSADKNTAEVILEFNGISVKGKFFFNDKGEQVRFETGDRYRSERGQNKPVKWAALSSGYVEKNGIKFAGEVSAVWLSESREFEYFRGKIKEINYEYL